MQLHSTHPRPHAAFSSLKPGHRANLTTCLPWTSVLRSWFRHTRSDMRTQHDAAHFLDHLLQAAAFAPLDCSWRATDPATHDTGSMPLRMDLRATLQECVHYWHEESSRHLHMLDCRPQPVLLHISRYLEANPNLKDLSPIQLDPGQTVLLPCMDDAQAVQWVSYRLACLVCPIGSTLTTGHYRAVVTTARSEGAFQFHILDDSTKPQTAKRRDLHDIATGSYLLGLSRCE